MIEASNGKPVLIFYSYIHDRDRISKRFKVTELKTSKDIEAWNKGEIEIAIAHPQATLNALNDYRNMEAIIEITPDEVKGIKEDMAKTRSSVPDGMHVMVRSCMASAFKGGTASA